MAKEMNERLWGNLAEEFLDRIVAFLPLPALSRFRVVSAKYNTWIFSAEFQKLCAQLPLRESRVWMVCQGKMANVISANFKVCAGAKLFGSAPHEAMLPYFGPKWKRDMRAALGSLLYVECTNLPDKPPPDGSYPVYHDMIADFSTMTCVKLPEPIVLPERWYGYSEIMFGQCGDHATGAFKIVIMDLRHWVAQNRGMPYSFQVYNSVTQSWKELHPEASFEFTCDELINCVFIFDKVFCLMRMGPSVGPCFHQIVVFDTLTEKYQSAMVVGSFDIPNLGNKLLASLKLIAANGRLHLTGWLGEKTLLVFEVDLPNKKLSMISELPKSLVPGITSSDVHIGGHKDCIFLYSSERDYVIYDLCRKTWRVLRSFPRLGGEVLSSKFLFFVEGDHRGDE